MATQANYKEGLDGIQFLRNLVSWSNARTEELHVDKSPKQLINDYLKYLNDITDLEGRPVTEY